MSNAEIKSLIAALSPEAKAELRDRLNAKAQLPPMTDEELSNDPAWQRYQEFIQEERLINFPAMTDKESANDPALKFLEELQYRAPLDLPADFGRNHNHYIHGAPKIEE